MTTAVRSLTIATAGHVDHGKTSLVRRITGSIEPADAPEMTVDLGYSYLDLESQKLPHDTALTLGFVDVPGHTNFIGNMLSGIGSVDAVLVVVAADDGVMPQTREHVAILDLLDINRGAIAVTKCDVVDSERVQQVIHQISSLTHGTSLAAMPVISVSSVSGQRVDELVRHFTQLLQEKAVSGIDDHYSRFTIDRSFSPKGIGTVLTGVLRNGTLQCGDSLQHSSTGQMIRVKGIRHHTMDQTSARAGQRLALHVDKHSSAFKRGHWLADSETLTPTCQIDAHLRYLGDFLPAPRASYHLYLGPQHSLATLSRIGGMDSPYFHLRTREPVLAWLGDPCILLDPGGRQPVAGGIVVNVDSGKLNCGVGERLHFLRSQAEPPQTALFTQLTEQRSGVSLHAFARSRGLRAHAAMQLLRTLPMDEVITLVNNSPTVAALPRLLHRRFFANLREWVLESLATHHEQFPDKPGLSAAALIGSAYKLDREALPFVLNHLQAAGELISRGGYLALPDHRAKLSPELESFMLKMAPLLAESGFVAPRTRELSATLDMPLDALDRQLAAAAKAALLVKVADNRHYLPETLLALSEFVTRLAQKKSEEASFSVIEFRDASGIGRNLSIELLEYFDSVGFTRRVGNRRILGHSNFNRISTSGDGEQLHVQ